MRQKERKKNFIDWFLSTNAHSNQGQTRADAGSWHTNTGIPHSGRKSTQFPMVFRVYVGRKFESGCRTEESTQAVRGSRFFNYQAKCQPLQYILFFFFLLSATNMISRYYSNYVNFGRTERFRVQFLTVLLPVLYLSSVFWIYL